MLTNQINWIKVEIEVPVHDFIQQVKVRAKKLCLIRNQGKLYMVQNTCPHAGGILSGGWCEKGNIVCPIHRYEYDLDSGRGAEGQGDYIKIYPLEMRDDGLYVGFRESLWERFFGKNKV
ncbi:MAG: Rieske (2Fe-2S) protein [Pedobacter sp.]|nr:Rieske (2Fe-2S) protein [Pedobacter sp.]MDQ8051839.1 Rieske (2Fe-2S) protein [Pedobacter sp.]